MARPIKEGMDYFPHDTAASNDKKIEALRAIYGNDGYAFYFIMLEQIYQEPSFELVISDAETREEMLQILARKVAVTKEVFTQILNTAIKWECFDKELYEQKGVLTSNGIKKRSGVVLEKRQKMRVKYQQDKEVISDAETTQETGEETPQSKVKIKVKESKAKENIYTPEFEKWYAEYPRSQAKQDSFKNFENTRKEKGLDYIWQCTRNYINYLNTNPKQKDFIYSSNNFFGRRAYYLDYETEVSLNAGPSKYQTDVYSGARQTTL